MKLKTLVENHSLKHINLITGNATFEVESGEQYIWVTENTVLLEIFKDSGMFNSESKLYLGNEPSNKTTINCILVKRHVNKLLDMGMDYLLEKGVSVTNE